jgi:hypothetical protein
MASLRAWLRRSPQPAKLRVRTEDDELRTIELSDDVRNRWKAAEEAVLACRATSVECLNAKDGILRAQKLEVEARDDDDDERSDGGYDRKGIERTVSRERRDMAAMLEAQGRAINEAHERGAAAANTGQEHLVALVDVLTHHLTQAITNVNNLSVNYANLLTEQAQGGGDDNKELLNGFIQAALQAHVGNGKSPKKEPAK